MGLQRPDLKKPVFLIYPEKKKLIEQLRCPECKKTIREEEFKDIKSKTEYSIS